MKVLVCFHVNMNERRAIAADQLGYGCRHTPPPASRENVCEFLAAAGNAAIAAAVDEARDRELLLLPPKEDDRCRAG